jgi:predicted cupin superfamily sugar epimerase
MSQCIQGTFTTGAVAAPGEISDALVIPTGTTTARLTTLGLDASNTVKTQKVTAPGTAWADQTTYNSDQTNLGITVAAGEQWRLVHVAATAIKDIRYKLSAES